MIAGSEFARSCGRVKPGLGSIYRLFHMGELLCLIGLLHVISGILAGGSLVSAWCFCCFTRLLVWPCDFVVLPFVSAAIPCRDDTVLSSLA